MSWRTRVPGSNRIGTIPFMALDLLLEKYGEEVPRCYYHELEAFIWMLPFVFLAYDNGKLDPKNLFIKSWITSDYITCGEKKLAFVAPERLANALSSVDSAFKNYKGLMLNTCVVVKQQHYERQLQDYEKLRQQVLSKSSKISGPAPHVEHPTMMWDRFISLLSFWGIDHTRLLKHRPAFDSAHCQDLVSEMETIYNSLGLAI